MVDSCRGKTSVWQRGYIFQDAGGALMQMYSPYLKILNTCIVHMGYLDILCPDPVESVIVIC